MAKSQSESGADHGQIADLHPERIMAELWREMTPKAFKRLNSMSWFVVTFWEQFNLTWPTLDKNQSMWAWPAFDGKQSI